MPEVQETMQMNEVHRRDDHAVRRTGILAAVGSAACLMMAGCGPDTPYKPADSRVQPVAAPMNAGTGGRIENPFDRPTGAPYASPGTVPPEIPDVVADDMEAAADRMDAEAAARTGTPADVPAPYAASTRAPVPATSSAVGNCSDGKRTCGDMAGCEDATFHLQRCGMSRLDGDGDGTPCEKLC